jgi:flagellar basal-body rod modification protein FlgD
MNNQAINQIGTTAVAGAPSAGALTASKGLGKEDFLKLLVAQLSHQDPLNPADSSAFVAQLAQFSSLEQLMSVNGNLDALRGGQDALANAQLTSLIGKTIDVRGDTLHHLQVGGDALSFNLGGPAERVAVDIADGGGSLVRTLELGEHAAGLNSVVWDGKDFNGRLVTAGDYRIQVRARGEGGQSVVADTQLRGTVTGLRFEAGAPLIEIGTLSVRAGDVQRVRE